MKDIQEQIDEAYYNIYHGDPRDKVYWEIAYCALMRKL